MSRKIIQDLVLPIILKILEKNNIQISSHDVVRDERLESFFEDELKKTFEIRGSAAECKDLEAALLELQNRDPDQYRELVRLILNKYIKHRVTLDGAKLLEKEKELKPKQVVELLYGHGSNTSLPPDRFDEFRRKQKQNPLNKWGVTQ